MRVVSSPCTLLDILRTSLTVAVSCLVMFFRCSCVMVSWTVGRSGFLGTGVLLLLGELGELGESWGWVYRSVTSELMGESGDP